MKPLSNAGLLVGAIVVGIALFMTLFAPLLVPHDPFAQDLTRRLVPPFWMDGSRPEHLLGTDQLGRDYLSRLIGITFGVAGGFFGGRIDDCVLFAITARLSILLEAEGLEDSFGPVRAVRGAALSIRKGETHCLVGESGCGKSVTALAIMGLLARNGARHATKLSFDGQDLRNLSEREMSRLRGDLMAMIFQEPMTSLNPRRRVRDIVAMPLDAQGTFSRAQTHQRVDAMLARVGLPDAMGERFPAELSGGQRQRVAIARALVLRPRIVVCDEPTSALDVSVQAQILNLLAELRRDLGLTYLFISHNLAVVEHVATEVAVMYLGRIVEQRGTEALFAAPAHPYTRALLASVLTPEPGLGIPDTGLGDTMPDPANVPPGCRFHPRCPVAVARCRSEPPADTRMRDGFVACHLAT